MTPALLVDAVVPALLLLAFAEWVVVRRRSAFDWRESLASLGVAAGHRLAGGVGLVVLGPVFEAAWRHRVATVPLDRPWGVALLFLLVELVYYAQHRLSHRVRWLWASHAVHHTSEQLTVSAAYRLAWTDFVSGTPLFAAPLLYVGFAPGAVVGAVAITVTYQFWVHTEVVGRLGWFDLLFNSPSNHRVHHAHGSTGRNFGGVLVLYDHLFGTYAPERERRARYGVTPSLRSYQPLVIAFAEWRALGRAVRAAPSWRSALRVCVGPPC